MNKVITINLGGNAYQLEEAGYDALRAYLETAAARLANNPDRDEIITDIERAIAEKFRALLGSHKNVIETHEVAAVLAEMGPIEAEATETAAPGGSASTGAAANTAWTGTAGASGAGATQPPPPPLTESKPRRLYRIADGEMIAGVCNGIAVYLNIDPTFVRLAFVLVAMVFGSGILAYIIMAIVIPEAVSPEEKAAAAGPSPTAQEFIRRARSGYYEALRGFPDRYARREWKRRFKREMRANARQWRQHWRYSWRGGFTPPSPMPSMPTIPTAPPLHPGMAFLMPLLSLLHGAVTILWVCALISLLSTGDIFGHALPFNLPVWAAVVGLVLIYGMAVSPLKTARHACYWGSGQQRHGWFFVFFLEAGIWLVVSAILCCFAWHYFPEVREAVQSIPQIIHQAGNDIQNWWHSK